MRRTRVSKIDKFVLSRIEQGLIDEYRIMVNPIVLRSGGPMFKDIKDRIALKLLKTETFGSGVVVLYYHPS